MQKTLISLGAWILLGWAVGEWINPTTGWFVLTAGLLGMILVSGTALCLPPRRYPMAPLR